MKVMVLANPMHSKSGGGAEKVSLELTNALGDTIAFIVVSPDVNSSIENGFLHKGKHIEVDVRWHEPTRNMLHKFAKFLHRVRELRRVIREENPDLILSNSFYYWHHLIAGFKLGGLTSKKVILRFGVPVSADINKHKRRGKLYVMLMRLGMYSVDRMIVATQGIADELGEKFNISLAKIEVINNPIPLTEILTLSQEKVDDPLFDNDLPIVLTVARLVPEKNQTLLIKAFQKVLEHVDANLVIIGTGSCEGQLRRLVHNLDLEEKVYFLGWQDNPFKYMRRADIFVLSSHYEGFGNVIVEAMACGCPVVATDCPYGPSEILGGGEYGLLVPNGDEEMLARGIVRVLGDEKLRQTLVKKGKQRASAFNADMMSDQYARIFHELSMQ